MEANLKFIFPSVGDRINNLPVRFPFSLIFSSASHQLHKSFLQPRTTSFDIPVMAPAPKTSKRVTEAQNLSKADSKRAEEIYKDIISKGLASGDAGLHEYEAALMGLGKLYRDAARSNDLAELVTTSRSKLSSFAKAKTAKLGTG